MKDIRDTIAEASIIANELCRNSQRELRTWSEGCLGETMHHVSLSAACDRIDRAVETMTDLQRKMHEARDAAAASLKEECAA